MQHRARRVRSARAGTVALLSLAVVGGLGGVVAATHWSYHEPGTGPEQWGKLDPAWAVADTGREQSPINIETAKTVANGELPPLKFNYQAVTEGATVVNNGHTVQLNLPAGQTLDFGGTVYHLLQFHFHAPSENTIDGQHLPLCVHMVHKSEAGKLLVVGVLYRNGKPNHLIDEVFEAVGHGGGHGQHGAEPAPVKFAVDPNVLLPAGRGYYNFPGSLTTPPCSEGVTWVVMQEIAESDPAIAGTILGLFGGPTNRPVQPLNDRVVQLGN